MWSQFLSSLILMGGFTDEWFNYKWKWSAYANIFNLRYDITLIPTAKKIKLLEKSFKDLLKEYDHILR